MCGFYNLTEGANQVISQSKNVSSIIKPTTNDVDIIAAIHFLHHHKKRKWLQNTYNLSKYSVQARFYGCQICTMSHLLRFTTLATLLLKICEVWLDYTAFLSSDEKKSELMVGAHWSSDFSSLWWICCGFFISSSFSLG